MDLTKNVNEIITDMAAAIDNLKEQILQAVYPVGSVYVSITDSRNPTDILGFGTWEAMPAGYGLVAQGTATAEDGRRLTFTAGQKSGEFRHQSTVDELASHVHPYKLFASGEIGTSREDSKQGKFLCPVSTADVSKAFLCEPGKSNEFHIYGAGGNQHHNNVSPCISAYIWKRVS